MIAIVLSVRAQEGSRYDRFNPLVKGVLIPSVGVFGVTWDTDLIESTGGELGKSRGGELGQGKGRARGKAGVGAGPTHDLARTPAFGSSGVLFHIPGEP